MASVVRCCALPFNATIHQMDALREKGGGISDLPQKLGNRNRRKNLSRQNRDCFKRRASKNLGLEAPPGIEPGMEVLQTSALPLGDGAVSRAGVRTIGRARRPAALGTGERVGAGNGIRTRDFDLGKVALYH